MIEKEFKEFQEAEQIFFTGCCIIRGSDYIRKIHMVNGKWHNISGPADIYYYDFVGETDEDSQYFIDDVLYNEQKWYSHPLVQKFVVNSILDL